MTTTASGFCTSDPMLCDIAIGSRPSMASSAVIRTVRNGKSRSALSPWLEQLLQRKPPKLVAVALANKLARIAWKLMATGATYAGRPAPTAAAGPI